MSTQPIIRKARMTDARAIQEIVAGFAAEGLLLPLSMGDVMERLRDFFVAEIDGQVVGTVAVHVTWERLVELRSLTVSRAAQGHKLGAALMDAALAEAGEFAALEIFTLTYIPEFFAKWEFQIVTRESLPHKVWRDCLNCPKHDDCDETAMKLVL